MGGVNIPALAQLLVVGPSLYPLVVQHRTTFKGGEGQCLTAGAGGGKEVAQVALVEKAVGSRISICGVDGVDSIGMGIGIGN